MRDRGLSARRHVLAAVALGAVAVLLSDAVVVCFRGADREHGGGAHEREAVDPYLGADGGHRTRSGDAAMHAPPSQAGHSPTEAMNGEEPSGAAVATRPLPQTLAELTVFAGRIERTVDRIERQRAATALAPPEQVERGRAHFARLIERVLADVAADRLHASEGARELKHELGRLVGPGRHARGTPPDAAVSEAPPRRL